MKKIKVNRTTSVGTAIVSAVSLKLCCWGPLLLTSIAGVGGSSVYFSWLSTLKPYLLAISFLSLGLAFYQIYRPRTNECRCSGNCEAGEASFIKSKLYVWLVAVFVIVMTSISYFPQKFDKTPDKEIMIVEKSNLETIELNIGGLSCTGCEENINHSVRQLDGIIGVRTSYEKGSAVIKFDKSRTNMTKIKDAIKSRGFIIKSVVTPEKAL